MVYLRLKIVRQLVQGGEDGLPWRWHVQVSEPSLSCCLLGPLLLLLHPPVLPLPPHNVVIAVHSTCLCVLMGTEGVWVLGRTLIVVVKWWRYPADGLRRTVVWGGCESGSRGH